MFEREVKFIYDFNSNKVKKLGPTATFTELLPLGIHPAILQYISAEIEFRVFEDRQTLLKHSMFDYSGSKITQHFQKIADEIKKEKRFSTDFFSKVILHATSFNVNYLIRPNWSLRKLIFDTSESNNVAEILQILNYAYFYKHTVKVIRNYLDKKKLITLNKEEFAELLLKIDDVSINTYGNDILESAIKAMSSFFNIGSMKQNTVPLQGIAVFLQEKKLTEQIGLIEKNIDGDIKGKIGVNDLRSILLNVPLQRTEVMDASQDTKEESVTLENEPEPVEKEDIEDERIDETPVEEEVPDETKDQADESEEEQIEDEVEINLRKNKEKEVAETEEEPEPLEEAIHSEPNKELLGIDEEEHDIEAPQRKQPKESTHEEEKAVEKEEVALEDEHINEAAEYLVDQTDNSSEDIILTVEDEEKYAAEHSEELEEAVEEDEEEFEREEATELPDEDETELSDSEEIVTDESDEVHLVEDSYGATEDDYSFPVKDDNDSELLREDDFEEVDELHIEENDEIEQLNIDDEDNDSEEVIADEYHSEDFEEEDEAIVDETVEEETINEDGSEEKIEEKSTEEVEEDERDDEEIPQTSLFGDIPDDEYVNSIPPGDDFIEQFGSQNHAKRIDIADLLENKNMTRIIAVVFDYDMEEFANAVEKICDSQNSQEAFGTLQEIFELNQVNPSSKEAQAFKDIISEYFEQE